MAEVSGVCDGCVGVDQTKNCFVRIDFNDYDDCPCGHCIIKVMCRKSCLERVFYYQDRKIKGKNSA